MGTAPVLVSWFYPWHSCTSASGQQALTRMPNFIEKLFAQLQRSAGRVVLREVRGEQFASVTGGELLDQIQRARAYLRRFGMVAGDRCAIVGANSIRWVVIDLALTAEGIVVVPLYSRQPPAELEAMMQDCQPRLLIADDAKLQEALQGRLPSGTSRVSFDQVLEGVAAGTNVEPAPLPRNEQDVVKIIYTSGTSGEPKGVCLNVGNVSFMLSRTTRRLDQLMQGTRELDRVFHYLPF